MLDTISRIGMNAVLFSPKLPGPMHDMTDYILEKANDTFPKIKRRKFVFGPGQGRAFHHADRDYTEPLLSRPQVLDDSIQTPGEIEKIYPDRIVEITERKYSDIEDELLKSFRIYYHRRIRGDC